MSTEIPMPMLGEVMDSGFVAQWLQPEGAWVDAGAPLFDVETDKITFTVEAAVSGYLHRLAMVGDELPVGAAVAMLTDAASPAEGASSS